jgi:hypothetical protein
MKLLVLCSLIFLPLLARALYLRAKSRWQLRITNAYCDADRAFCNWKVRNPNTHHFQSEEGTRLFRDLEKAEVAFYRAHPTVTKEHT